MPAHAPAPTNMTHLPPINKMKRKRSESTVISPRFDQPPLKKAATTMSHVEVPSPDALVAAPPVHGRSVPTQQVWENPEPRSMAGPSHMELTNSDLQGIPPTTSSVSDTMDDIIKNNTFSDINQRRKSAISLNLLQHTIESQFNLEILLKHRELRLIDQELAKCQVALEQLRRCQVIPYPAQSSTLEDMETVSAGSGPVYSNHAPHAPPWGITEGPYTRHYKSWLMPDPAFDDSITENVNTSSTAGKTLPDRPTRGVKAGKGAAATQPRPQRGSTSAQLDALPHAYRESKQDRGPMIVKRPTDGHMVKLVCLDCRRSNFNSVQGFINHCRIQHARQFASHSSAIEASGEEVDGESEGGVAAEVNAPQGATSAGLVHPLIRSARPPTLEPATLLPNRQGSTSPHLQSSPSRSEPPAMSTPRQNQINDFNINNTSPIPFKPSPQTPHLSALLARIGHGGDLDDMVTDAKTKPEVDLMQQDNTEEDSYVDEPDEPDPQSRSTRGVIHGGVRLASSNKSKPMDEDSLRLKVRAESSPAPRRVPASVQTAAYPSPNITATHLYDHQENSTTYGSTPLNLSPNTTDPHPAPSLVSDDDEYDNMHSESETSSHIDGDEEEDHYMHPPMLDHEDLELGESSGISLAHPEKVHGSTAGRRSRPSTAIHDAHEERHVSFASPVRRQRRESKTIMDGNDSII
ncbi:MAG: hypothetical protein Q9164_005707 [Protoblastenia rupestris]